MTLGGARRGRYGYPAIAVLLLAGLVTTASAMAPVAPSGARSRSAGSEPAGPLSLTRVSVGQHKLHGSIVLAVGQRLPPLRQLKRFPSRLGSDERHLCLAADGRAIRKRLLCVGGRVRRGRVRVGVSRYRKNGTARKDHGFRARLKRISPRAIRLGFKLHQADFGTGHFRYRATSAWHGPECAPPSPPRDAKPSKRRHKREAGSNVCHSRLPRQGSRRGRIRKVVRAGCTTGRAGVYRQGPTRHKRIALTFDDGPSPYTARIMRALDRTGAKGTFFELGNQIGGYQDVMRKLIAHGHEIGNHSYAHEQYPSSSSMAHTNSLIKSATGFRPCDFRPPYGAYDGGTVAAARDNGLSVALWNVETSDYTNPGADAIYSRAIQAGRGSIVIMHDGGGNRSQTAAAVPRIVHKLRSRGYRLVTVTELLGGHFRLREKR